MKKILGRRPSAAMIVAVIALIAALAGTAIAGGGFITKKKFNKRLSAVNAAIATTVRGPITYSTVQATIPVTPAGSGGTDVAAPCPPGTAPMGGGIKVSNDLVVFVNDSHPTTIGWAGTVFNGGTATHSAQVTAICAIVSSTTGTRPSS